MAEDMDGSEKKAPMERVIEGMGLSIRELMDEVSKLQERLQPVMLVTADNPKNQGDEPVDESSLHVSRLREYERLIRGITAHLSNIYYSLEV